MPGSDIRVKAGTQRQLIQIMQQVNGPGNMAGGNTILVPFAGCQTQGPSQPPLWAEIAPASAKDVIRNGQTISQTVTPITIRWLPASGSNLPPGVPNNATGFIGVTPGMVVQRLQSSQGVYYVTGSYTVQGIVNVDERNWKITMACVALGANS